MAYDYYYEKIPATPEFIEDVERYAPHALEGKTLNRLIESDLFLDVSDRTVGLFAKLDDEDALVEITYGYHPHPYDPGIAFTDEYRAKATLTQYSPTVRIKCQPVKRSWRPFLKAGLFEVGTDYFPRADVDPRGIDYSDIKGGLEDYSEKTFEVYINVGDNADAKMYITESEEWGSLFIYTDRTSMETLVTQLESGDFYHFSAYVKLPFVKIRQAPLELHPFGEADIEFFTLNDGIQDGFRSAGFELTQNEPQEINEVEPDSEWKGFAERSIASLSSQLQSVRVLLVILIALTGLNLWL